MMPVHCCRDFMLLQNCERQHARRRPFTAKAASKRQSGRLPTEKSNLQSLVRQEATAQLLLLSGLLLPHRVL